MELEDWEETKVFKCIILINGVLIWVRNEMGLHRVPPPSFSLMVSVWPYLPAFSVLASFSSAPSLTVFYSWASALSTFGLGHPLSGLGVGCLPGHWEVKQHSWPLRCQEYPLCSLSPSPHLLHLWQRKTCPDIARCPPWGFISPGWEGLP